MKDHFKRTCKQWRAHLNKALHADNQLKISTSSISAIIHHVQAVQGTASEFSHQNKIFILENKCQLRSNLARRLAKGLPDSILYTEAS